MIVLDAASRGWTVIYVGKSADVRRRGRDHLRDWFTAPGPGYWIPNDATAFLDDPIVVFNANTFATGLPDRANIQRRVRERCRFCFAIADLTDREHGLEHLEYVLQEAVKQHADINVPGHLGDSGMRHPPSTDLVIFNRFVEPHLRVALPNVIEYRASQLRLS
ncbi:MAG: hypothetical protein OXQ89_00250 [Rhodospirillaceae bacterium]|nr:hypothetical protein [Rhodospirillaceae bacterium]